MVTAAASASESGRAAAAAWGASVGVPSNCEPVAGVCATGEEARNVEETRRIAECQPSGGRAFDEDARPALEEEDEVAETLVARARCPEAGVRGGSAAVGLRPPLGVAGVGAASRL